MAINGLGNYLKNKTLAASLNGTGSAYTGTATNDVALYTAAMNDGTAC